MKLFWIKKIALASACSGIVLFAASTTSFAKKWELHIRAGKASYLASYSNGCSSGSANCRSIKMCGRKVYVAGASGVLKAYREGYRVKLYRDSPPYKTLCVAKKR